MWGANKMQIPVGFVSVIFLFSIIQPAYQEKILSIQFFTSRSHKNMYKPMLIELANRGHQVTVVNSEKSERVEQIKNYREVHGLDLQWSRASVFEMKGSGGEKDLFLQLTPILQEKCAEFFQLQQIQRILSEKYDLIMMEPFMNECIFGMLHHFNTTFIFVNSFMTPFWLTGSVGLTTLPSITPLPFLEYTDNMNFLQRSHNFIVQLSTYFLIEFHYKPKMEAIYKKYIGESTPSIDEIARGASLLIENSHPSMNFPRPIVPEIIEAGGMHCAPPKPLLKDLEDFIKTSGSDGFIYFSLGSIMKSSDMPEKYRKIFLRVFAKLKQMVLWKWDGEAMADLPANVKLSKWLPQQDVLGHRKCKLFITHGGLLSLQEAVYHGVPILGFPLFGDQHWNIATAVQRGIGSGLEFTDLTEEVLLASIHELLSNSKYMSRVQALSQLFKDQPITPLSKAIFSVEYVLRHKGFPFRSPARELNLMQYFSVDVIVTLAFILLTALLLIYYTTTTIIKYAKRSSTRKTDHGKGKSIKQKQKKS